MSSSGRDAELVAECTACNCCLRGESISARLLEQFRRYHDGHDQVDGDDRGGSSRPTDTAAAS